MNKVRRLYATLLRRYGPQGWWPAESQYEIIVGALLTQNTNWKNVESAISNLKRAGRLEPEGLLCTGSGELEALIRPSGFYRQKAERLRALTRKYLEIAGRQKSGARAVSREELLAVKGVGKETADSILLYAYGKPIFVIDAYTRRFCKRHSLFEGKEYDEYREFFESSLPRSAKMFKEYHALIVRWGKENGQEKKTKK